MRVYHNIGEFKKIKNAVTTVGIFDGVHLGHQKIIELVVKKARQLNSQSVIITFEPHPRLYFDPTSSQNLKIITEVQEKVMIFEQLGIDHLLIIPFNAKIANLSSEEFINDIVINTIGTDTLLLGYDHRFGKNREGSFKYLQEHQGKFGIKVFEISRLDIDEAAVSSTRIRTAIQSGDLQSAMHLLGRLYSFTGKIVEGKKLGKTIGYPTANIHVESSYKLLPKMGVYAVEVLLGGEEFGGMLNIGFNPTILVTKERKIEAHIFDFDKNVYGKEITVKFLSRLRDEQKFNNLDELKAQLIKDELSAREICLNSRLLS